MASNFKDYLLNEALSSAALKDQVELTARKIAKAGGDTSQAIDIMADSLSKLYQARKQSVKKMIEDKVKEYSK